MENGVGAGSGVGFGVGVGCGVSVDRGVRDGAGVSYEKSAAGSCAGFFAQAEIKKRRNTGIRSPILRIVIPNGSFFSKIRHVQNTCLIVIIPYCRPLIHDYQVLALSFADSSSSFSFAEGSLTFARKIMAAMIYGLKEASL